MTLNRLKEYIDFKGISVSAFEKSVGMSNASYGKSLRSGGAIGSDKLENILAKYSDLNPLWLLTGEGEMLREATSSVEPINPTIDRLLSLIESQQRTIENLSCK